MSIPVPLAQLREELEDRGNAAYLLTVSDDGRPHCVAVAARWDDALVVVGTGATSARNAAARPQVTLLSPPAPTGATNVAAEGLGGVADHHNYTLIVDGQVVPPEVDDLASRSPTSAEGGPTVRIRPTHAVLHRPARAPDGTPVHDCLPVTDRAGEPT